MDTPQADFGSGTSAPDARQGHDLPLRLAGGVAAALGLLVLIGWHTHLTALVQVGPTLVPMQYNTALAFLLSGGGLVAFTFGLRRLTLGAGLLVAAMGFLTSLQYVFGVSLGIDQLLFTPDVTMGTSHPGRMSPLTAMSFVLIGGALVLLAWPLWSGRRAPLLGTFGSLIAAVGAMSLVGYLTGRAIGYTLGSYTAVALHTSAGLVVLGGGMLARAWSEAADRARPAPSWLPVPIAIAFLAATLLVWQALSLTEANDLRRATESALRAVSEDVPQQVHVRVQPLVRLADRTVQQGLQLEARWQADAQLIVDDYPSIREIEWSDPSFTVRQSVTPEGAEAPENRLPELDEDRRSALEAVRAGAEAVLTPVIEGVQGGRWFLAATPIGRGPDLQGFVVGVVDVGMLLDSTLAEQVPGYAIAVLEGDNEIYRRTGPDDAAYESALGQEADVAIDGGSWRLRVWPGAGVVAEQGGPQPSIVLAIGALMSLLLAALVGLAQMSQERGRRFRELFETSRDAMMTLAPAGLADFNPAALELFGYASKTEVLGKDPADLSPPTQPDGTDSRVAAQKHVAAAMSGGSDFFEWTHQRADGTSFLAEVLLSRLSSREVMLQATVRDVTARKRADAERVRLSAAVEQATDSVVSTDPNGRILYVNGAFEEVSGYTRAEVIGENPRILKSGRMEAAHYRSMWDALTRGESWSGVFVNKRKDGSLFELQSTIFPVIGPTGEIVSFVSIGHDMTHQRELEMQLRQAQKMEAVGRLAAGVAHDFNNVLAVILMTTELMLGDTEESDERRADIEEIQTATKRAAALTHQLLAFSRQQVLDPRALDLNQVVAGFERMLRRVIGEDIECHAALAPGLGTVMADPGQLEQVLMNLVVNARDAMATGGKLTIETANADLDENYVESHPSVQTGRYVMLAVSDDGAGMDEKTQARIFEPFFTTKRRGEGTGLGLSTVYGIVKQSGGYIWLYSELGLGTTFKIYLPRVDTAPEALRAVAEAVDSLHGTETLLLAEDEAPVRRLAERILESYGYRVLAAASGNDALELAASHAGSLDLLVTDVVMPGMSGPELAKRLGALRADMKTLYLSGYTDETIVRHGVLGSGFSFLQKPFTPEALARKVREVLGQGD